jgi:NADH:ubiquinone oxidoreductase subunit 4 (subunit M)
VRLEEERAGRVVGPVAEDSWAGDVALAMLTLLLLWLGVYPDPFTRIVQTASGALL